MEPTQQDNSAEITPEQMAADLKQLMEATTARYNTFHGRQEASKTDLTKSQNTAIASLFQILHKNGVDPSNQDQVNQFLEEMKQTNPDGYEMFEMAINNLLSEKTTLGQQSTPTGIAEPLNTTEQQGVEPTSPGGATSMVNQIPAGPINGQGQPMPVPPVTPPPAPIPDGLPG